MPSNKWCFHLVEMAPSRKSFSCTWLQFFTTLVMVYGSLGKLHARDEIISAFFASSHIFQAAPEEGITTVSTPEDGYLTNGDTGDLVSTFIFMPPSGFTPDQYTITYSCDSDTVAASDSCVIDNVVAAIVDSTATAYNTTVTCSFTSFPGTTSCNLYATLTSAVTRGFRRQRHNNIARQSTTQYVSDTVTVNVYGVVFYIPNSNGEFTASSIVSGSTSSYDLSSYDRTDQGVREIETFLLVPGQTSSTGSIAVDFFSSASITVTVGDYILKYDPSICSLTDASFSNGLVVLPSTENCGIGVAVESESAYPTMGMHFRIYKSGKFTITMAWDSFGTSSEGYEQTLVFNIAEQAPPVITAVQKLAEYRSTPCETETVTITGYNLRYASQRVVSVQNSDGSTTEWSESSSGLTYDDTTDTSVVSFDSSGGDGTDVDFSVIATYDSGELSSVVLDNTLSLKLSFSTPPVLTSMSPTSTAVDGGDEMTLTGSFDGFDEEGFVSVGGYVISASDLTVTDSSTITFTSPPLSSLGQSYTYDVSVGICAESTGSVSLSYEVSPIITISSADTSVDDSGAYIVPAEGSSSFLVEVSGNNDGMEYVWKLFSSDGSEISTGNAATNLQIFELSHTLISSDSTYTVQCQGTNSLGLSDQDEVTATLAAAGTEYMTVSVYSVENLTRSTDTTTLVQSSVQVYSESGRLSRQTTSEVILEWSYRGSKFSPDDSTSEESSTGATKLGLEFNIARKDLRVGQEQLTLTAYVADNPSVSSSSTITLTVVESPLKAVINNGMNGTLLLEGEDLVLTGENSADPDILEGEGDANEGLSYSWFSCLRSLKATFTDAQDCAAILFPADISAIEITIASDDLSKAKLDDAAESSTYFSFGLRISKGDRTAESFATFELRVLPTPEKVPALSALKVVDVKGVELDLTDISTFSDVIILVESSDQDVTWSFDMAKARQKFLFTKTGALKSGDNFVTSRGTKSQSLLGFAAGSLDPMTEYTVQVTTNAVGSSIESVYDVSFMTADVPTLTCTPPLSSAGTTSETGFVITASLSFEAQKVEYCFYLVSSSSRKYSVGKGCSSVNFAQFTFPVAGTYGIECLAKTVSGAVVANETLADTIVLSTPTPSASETIIDTLTAKLALLNQEVASCEAVRDHTCLTNLISSASLFIAEVETAIADDTSDEALALQDGTIAYFEKMSQLSETLATKTVYRPNQIVDSIDQSYFMSQVPSGFVEQESTLYSYLTAAVNAANSTSSDTSEAVISNELVDKASAICNTSLGTVFDLAQGGTSRRRLRQGSGVGRSEIGVVLDVAVQMIGQLRAQQETCGYSGTESTEYPETVEGSGTAVNFNGAVVPSVQVGVKVSCTKTQISQEISTNGVGLEICQDAMSGTELQRVVSQVASIPSSAIEATGYVTDVDSYVTRLGFVKVDGLGTVPEKCVIVTMERNPEKLKTSTYDNLVGGVLTGLPTQATPNCTESTCYIFDLDGNSVNEITFTDEDIVVQSNMSGLFIAGNYTGKTDERALLEGYNAQAVRPLPIVGILLAFIVFAILAVWISVSNLCGVVDPSSEATDEIVAGLRKHEREMEEERRASTHTTPAGGAMNWEYVDRDSFARPKKRESEVGHGTPDVGMVVPDGARPPEYDGAKEPSK